MIVLGIRGKKKLTNTMCISKSYEKGLYQFSTGRNDKYLKRDRYV
jgi:hypothetical protein